MVANLPLVINSIDKPNSTVSLTTLFVYLENLVSASGKQNSNLQPPTNSAVWFPINLVGTAVQRIWTW